MATLCSMGRWLLLLVVLALALPAGAVPMRWEEGVLRGFPSLTDRAGKTIADGQLVQRRRGRELVVSAHFHFADGRLVDEENVFLTRPALRQRAWSFTERKGGIVTRRFFVDLDAGRAGGMKRGDDGAVQSWAEAVPITPGRTFVASGFAYAVKELMPDLAAGPVELETIAFTPKPRAAKVKVVRDGTEVLHEAGRKLTVDRITIHPEVPALAKLFVKVSDSHLWFVRGPPPQFVRSQSQLAEISDPVTFIDLLAPGLE